MHFGLNIMAARWPLEYYGGPLELRGSMAVRGSAIIMCAAANVPTVIGGWIYTGRAKSDTDMLCVRLDYNSAGAVIRRDQQRRLMLIYITLLPSYALYTIIPYRPPPAVGSAERSGPLI
jgi:hypothetical protein